MSDPSRLIDDPSMSSSLRADLAQAKGASLEGFAVGAGAAQLEAAIAAEAAAVGASAAAASGVSKGLVAAVLGVTAAGAISLWATRSEGPKVVRTDAMTVPSAHEEPSRSFGAAVHPREVAPALVPDPVVEPVPPAKEEPTPGSEPLAESAPPEPRAAPTTKPHRPRKASGNDEFGEARLIADARRAMETDPARAQRLLRKAKRVFPDGLLREEREALSILVQVELGNTEKAAAAAKRFLSAHEHGPYADAVRRAVR